MRVPNYTKGLVLERATPNQVNLGQIGAKGAVASGAAQLLDLGAQVQKQIETTNDMTAVNEAVIRRQKDDLDFQTESRKQNAENPLGYAKRIEPEYKKRDEAIMASLPSEAARQAYKASAQKINLRNYEEDLNWETKRSTEMFVNKADQSIQDLEVMAYRGVPLEELKKNRQATMLTLGSVLAADQLVKFDQQAESRITESYIKGFIDTDPSEAKRLLDSGEYDNALGVDNLVTLGNQAERAMIAEERANLAAQQRRLKLFTDDPAQLAIESGANTPEEIIEKQRQLGVAEGNLSVIPKERAAFISNQLEGAKNSTELLNQLQNIREQVGDENYNIAMKDLKKSGLSSRIELLSVMNPTQDRGVMDATFAMAKDGDEIRKRAFARRSQMPDATTQKIREEIGGELSDTLEVLALENNDQAQVARYQETMTDIAIFFIAQGQSVGDATKNATKWFNDKVVTAEINDRKFRVPQDYRPNEIERNLKALIKQTKLDNIPAINQALQNEATPVLHPDEKRYYLVDAIGQPIANNDKIIYFDVKDILQRGKDVKAEREQKIFDENLKKLMQ